MVQQELNNRIREGDFPLLYLSKRGYLMRSQIEAEKLYNQYEYLVSNTIRKNFSSDFANLHGLEKDDLLQIGRIGLFKAAQEYDSTKGTEFQTHAINRIRYSVITLGKKYSLRSLNTQTYQLANIVSIETPTKTDEGEEASLHDVLECDSEAYLDAEMGVALNRLSGVLPKRTMSIIKLRLKGYSYSEISKVLGVSESTVSQDVRKNKDIIYKNTLA